MNEQECREIYREAFYEPDTDFENRLFSLCGAYCRILTCGQETAAMLFALPCEIISDGKGADGYYIYAAATKKKYRGRGYMTLLIGLLLKEGKPLFLKPANDGLAGFYQRLGFTAFTARTYPAGERRAVPSGGFAALAGTENGNGRFCYTAMSFNSRMPLENLYFPYLME